MAFPGISKASRHAPEMIIGSVQKNPPAPLCVDGNVIDTVKRFKLLGINISDDLRWNAHVDALCAKVASRLYFLKILKRSGLPQNDLLCFYKSVIRSVVEYGCVIWRHNLTTAQSDRLEALQKRALRVLCIQYCSTIQHCPRSL